MKIYVDEMPKRCNGCPCFRNDIESNCGLDDGEHDYFLDEIDGDECPLRPVAERETEVRKDVVEKIKKWCIKNFNWVGNGTNTIKRLEEFLDQVERREDDEGN